MHMLTLHWAVDQLVHRLVAMTMHVLTLLWVVDQLLDRPVTMHMLTLLLGGRSTGQPTRDHAYGDLLVGD